MLPRSIIALLAATVLTPPVLARDLSGNIAIPENVSLPPGAVLVLDVIGPSEVESQETTLTGQSPLPFAIEVPDDPLVIRAGIRVGDDLQFLTDPQRVPAGAEAVVLENVIAQPWVATGFASLVDCGGQVIEISHRGDDVYLRRGDETRILQPRTAGSVSEFTTGASPETILQTEPLMIAWDGDSLRSCRFMEDGQSRKLTARGNEPGWQIVASEGFLTLSTQEGEQMTIPFVHQPEPEALRLIAPGIPDIIVAPRICTDSMTGLPYPYTVTTDHVPPLNGCGGDPASLLTGEWKVTEISGQAVPPESGAVLGLDGEHLWGRGGCNRLVGTMTLTGEAFRLNAGGMTMMACEEEAMALDAALTAALDKVDGVEIGPDGAPIFLAGDQPVVRTSR